MALTGQNCRPSWPEATNTPAVTATRCTRTGWKAAAADAGQGAFQKCLCSTTQLCVMAGGSHRHAKSGHAGLPSALLTPASPRKHVTSMFCMHEEGCRGLHALPAGALVHMPMLGCISGCRPPLSQRPELSAGAVSPSAGTLSLMGAHQPVP